jgi:glycosyltransferase involved in cell wall biosynthesis
VSRVLFWSADTAGCGHYRCEFPAAGLRAAGHDVSVGMGLPGKQPNACMTAAETLALASSNLSDVDVLVGQRVCNLEPSLLWHHLAQRTDRPKLVFELDDDPWSLQHERDNPAAAEWGPVLGNVERNLAVSDAVTVSTWQLAEVVSEFTSAPVSVVPNAVPDHIVREDFVVPDQVTTLGWQGSPTHDGDWFEDSAARTVVRWLQRHESVQLQLLGGEPSPLRNAPLVWKSLLPGTRDLEEHYGRIRSLFDVSLAPLRRSTFNRSKSDIRLLESAALGIPWIATDYGPYTVPGDLDHAIPPAEGGMRVRNQKEWREALDWLATCRDIRQGLSERGLRWARSRTVSAITLLWERALGL